MKPTISLLALTQVATAALTAHRFVTATGAVPAAGGNALGVARTDAAIGDALAVDVLGTAEAEVGGAVTAGAALEVDADGCVVPATTGKVVARALGAQATAGKTVEVFLIPN